MHKLILAFHISFFKKPSTPQNISTIVTLSFTRSRNAVQKLRKVASVESSVFH